MNINSYLKKYKDVSFDELEFNELDSLILSELSYMNLDMYTPSLQENKLISLSRIIIRSPDKFSYGSVDAKQNLKMIELMKSGKRFKHMQIGLCDSKVNESDKHTNQFFAVTYILPNNTMYIAYRGTDITINGWKEDFHMTFMDTIPSQADALRYTKRVLSKYDYPFYLGGHSKGGNLAFYSALNLDDRDLESRLIRAYSFDGPGFKDGAKQYPSYEYIKSKVIKYMTNRDWVGIVYNSTTKNIVTVSATGFLLGGHDPFSWQVNVNKAMFVRAKRLKSSQNSEVAFNKWLKSISDEDKVLACDIIFDFLSETKTVYDLPKAVRYALTHGKDILSGYSDEEKQRITKIVKKLIHQYMKVTFKTKKKTKKIEKQA